MAKSLVMWEDEILQEIGGFQEIWDYSEMEGGGDNPLRTMAITAGKSLLTEEIQTMLHCFLILLLLLKPHYAVDHYNRKSFLSLSWTILLSSNFLLQFTIQN